MSALLRSAIIAIAVSGLVYTFGYSGLVTAEYNSAAADVAERFIPLPTLDKADYDMRLLALAHVSTSTSATSTATTTGSGSQTSLTATSPESSLWPAKAPYPNAGAILPFQRVVAYYGNFYSSGMGILGEYPDDQLLAKLATTTATWAAADPTTPVLPAIQYIAVVAQGSAGREGKYILRMPDDQIEHALALADLAHGILILDVQVGMSTLPHELPLLEKYLKMRQVHLAIDPEFSMKTDKPPGTVIGTFDDVDVNYAAQYLARLVRDNNLPPKMLIVHRFTEDMVTNFRKIRPLPEVQIVMDMDGWGSQAKKKGTYNSVIYPEPVQFTGVKLFYKNDVKPPSTGLLTTKEVLNLTPAPIYIQYQ